MIKVNTEPIPTERVDVFELDGVVYQMDRVLPGSLALEAMTRFRTGGEVEATPWLMDEVLGAEAHKALRECKTLRKEDLAAITAVVRNAVFGEQEEEGKG